MIRNVLLSAAAILVFSPTVAMADDGFTELFNGRDLSGWINPPGSEWIVEDGVIALKREPDGQIRDHVYLWTEEQYGDFILELEFKVPERANSGVFIRTADIKNPVDTGLEIQVSNSYGRDVLTRGGTAGAVYDCQAPSANPIKKPGQWNKIRITCNGNVVQVELNGEQIIDMNLDRWTEPNKNPDGTSNKFSTPIKDFARVGHIGLQDHGRPVWYRNIRVKQLSE